MKNKKPLIGIITFIILIGIIILIKFLGNKEVNTFSFDVYNNSSDNYYYDQAIYDEDDFLGWIYQYWVDTDASDIDLAKDNSIISYANNIYYQILEMLDLEQTEYGEFYTPRWVVKYIVDSTISYYRSNNDTPVEQIKLLLSV